VDKYVGKITGNRRSRDKKNKRISTNGFDNEYKRKQFDRELCNNIKVNCEREGISKQKKEIIKKVHEVATCAHPGIRETYKKAKLNDENNGITLSEIIYYVKTCARCASCNPDRSKQKPLLKPVEIPNGPAEILSLDLVTCIRNSDLKYVLVCIDKFTKRVNYIRFKKTPTSKMILIKLEKTNFSKFSYPQVIISYSGPQFKGEVWRKMLATLQISARLATTAHPQSDGQS
jgi:hypothetical protein